MATVYLGLGSNLGDRALNIKNAIDSLNKQGIAVKKVSTIIETDPVGGPEQGKFLNGALEAETKLSPEDLHKTLKNIEKDLGRTPTVRNGPRTIDLDILLYNNLSIQTPELTIPHPQIFKRYFVVEPLKEIAPQVVRDLTEKLKPRHESHSKR